MLQLPSNVTALRDEVLGKPSIGPGVEYHRGNISWKFSGSQLEESKTRRQDEYRLENVGSESLEAQI